MCGICGIWNYKSNSPVDRNLLQDMSNSMTHRGPDDSGLYFEDANGLGLGFRRLAIIDLSPAGHQPMGNEDGSVWTVFNGEIYNFQSLRPHLQAKGHVFRSRSDTEVILHQYEECGEDSLQSFRGMFALAIWDRRQRQVLLGRDRIGKKPLYYYDDGERLVFASELKAILKDRSIPRMLDLKAVTEYLSLGYITSPRTILKGIYKLPPGHAMLHHLGQAKTWRYWDWLSHFKPDKSVSEQDWALRVRDALREAVRGRMISDVPLGAFLSGGVDSSAVVAMMAGLSEKPIKTFSIGFADQTYSELPFARRVAQQFGTEHHEYIVEPESIARVLPQLVLQLDEPFADSSALPTYYVSKIARQHVTVCLSGDGGDEAFAGYSAYDKTMFGWIDQVPRILREPALSSLAAVIPPFSLGNRTARRLALPPNKRYAFARQIFYADQIHAVMVDATLGNPGLPDVLNVHQDRAGHLDSLSQLQYLDGVTYLPEDILVKVDRTSMLNSLEVRCPLLDHQVLELAASVPPDLRVKDGAGKYILKQAMRGLLPDEVMDRPKQGFSIPGRLWIQQETAFVQGVLSERNLKKRGLFHPGVVEHMVEKNPAIGSNLWSQIWSLLVFELWCQQYLDA